MKSEIKDITRDDFLMGCEKIAEHFNLTCNGFGNDGSKSFPEWNVPFSNDNGHIIAEFVFDETNGIVSYLKQSTIMPIYRWQDMISIIKREKESVDEFENIFTND